MIDFENKAVFKLKANDDYAETVADLLVPGEAVLASFKSMRDGAVFTDRRIIAVNVQGLTGSKRDFTSLPYKNIVAYSVETAGTFDMDTELEVYFSTLGCVRFEFSGRTPIKEISRLISQAIFSR
ncbi:PH domain-containing protein [Consotaella salsifontis]|uniref:PH domain-containing protein n=1 Tax=Consotaella salsifontis TaxID=1365950 RepID=A0A1T4QXF1_9HYPH|nr:PH domain-containing protein [Consotaella salsifontis]SKA08335.1 PH domain-containing protein [Consotaella salsifontis]